MSYPLATNQQLSRAIIIFQCLILLLIVGASVAITYSHLFKDWERVGPNSYQTTAFHLKLGYIHLETHSVRDRSVEAPTIVITERIWRWCGVADNEDRRLRAERREIWEWRFSDNLMNHRSCVGNDSRDYLPSWWDELFVSSPLRYYHSPE